jgi:3-hydroxymyristoyl/3-hydroxydecanoyl-(acyl carrier protein) dehydratase
VVEQLHGSEGGVIDICGGRFGVDAESDEPARLYNDISGNTWVIRESFVGDPGVPAGLIFDIV